MNDQLALLAATVAPIHAVPAPGGPAAGMPSWELDEHTRDVGRQGIAAARRALRQASARAAA